MNVRIVKREQSIELSVTDSGPGIAPDEREKIFERFYRVPGSTGGGSGLGLAIVKDVAANHHAEILIESPGGSDGHGTVFTVVFPACSQQGKVLASNGS